MNEPPTTRIFAIICCAISIPMLLVLFIFSVLGIMDLLFPIVLPIFIGVGAFLLFSFVLIMVGLQCASNTESGWKSEDAPHSYSTTESYARPVFKIPMNCPSCQRAIQLDRVEWRDSETIVCPGCFEDIPVETSY